MRLLSWNIRDLLGDPLAVHRVVRSAAPDVVCFQEAPRRPGAAVRLSLLGRGTGLRCVAGGRRSGGTALFVGPDVEVRWAAAFRLPTSGRFTRTRGVSVADLDVPGLGEVTVASVHLPLDAASRLDHARRVTRVLAWRGGAAVVAGDLNEPAGAPAWTCWETDPSGGGPSGGGPSGGGLSDPWPDAGPTYPAPSPTARIDAVLVAPGLRARRVDPGPWEPGDVLRASDHLPVLAVLERETGSRL